MIGGIEEGGFLEGGDFFAAGEDLALVGIGLRSNFEACKQLMDRDLLGTHRLAIVKDENECHQVGSLCGAVARCLISSLACPGMAAQGGSQKRATAAKISIGCADCQHQCAQLKVCMQQLDKPHHCTPALLICGLMGLRKAYWTTAADCQAKRKADIAPRRGARACWRPRNQLDKPHLTSLPPARSHWVMRLCLHVTLQAQTHH